MRKNLKRIVIALFCTLFVLIIGSKKLTSRVSATVGDPLTFTSEENGSTIKIMPNGASRPTIYLSYSTDGGSSWNDFNAGGNAVQVDNGNTILIRAKDGYTNAALANGANDFHKFVMTGKFSVSGDVTTLLDKDGKGSSATVPSYCFNCLFVGCTSLTNAANLELYSTNLSSYCYLSMFSGCTSLVAGPNLPANIIPEKAYGSMFENCSSLKNAPVLGSGDGVTSVGYGSCEKMFSGCSLLETAPALPAMTLADYSYCRMFSGCASLKKTPELPAMTLYNCTYINMFDGCTALKTIPNLPATSVKS